MQDTHTVDQSDELIKRGVTLPMKYDQLKRYLPHRYPFMLIDRVTDCQPGHSIKGYKNVSINEPFFQGHFPDEPIMPGVLIVEAMAQLSGVLAFISDGITATDGYLFLFAGVDKVRFKRPVLPGDTLSLYSEYILCRRGIYKFDAKAVVDGKVVASAQVTIARQERPEE